ncbi:mannose-1-phosphate guanylyltransferase/mannose-6-phosphate isomerase [Rhodoferax sp. 4810]|uniref:mannose-1-phosphate guanylyltransferase n=1 Tax=Thiospirillum jenense TaxID=1653858 RepID=A0A839H656_9GAMM|nr:mannose-1-phosphate guanylyltransferase/mannose-6-phosphate isomerase [Thiospirillum jenense]MBB1072976.1 mannose-1-phosphate guanylyltransferase/mannose-6-phosphate isomerase [Rhodoferax jenense]MBB1124924.1 mannose-1-phosphate guanylyltransferase/mannose-6-phosphate isomerase [Thiospirillum jenense]
MSLQPVILSGGSGSRLWPLSREALPKQFLPLTSDHTMLQETVRRLDGLAAEHPTLDLATREPIVVCNDAHRFLVAEQFRLMQRRTAAIILEPVGRNTAPALTLAALAAVENATAADAPILLVMPADHTMVNAAGFRSAVADGYRLAAAGAVITFGIVPMKPETGYGYLQQGTRLATADLTTAAYQLDAFVEKPDVDTAQQYLASGQYLWNSGIFMLSARRWLELIAHFRADMAATTAAAMRTSKRLGDFITLDATAFAACPSDSIDYAVMEPLAAAAGTTFNAHDGGESDLPTAVVLPLDVGWSDVGAWSALWEVRDRDEAGNVLDGDAFVHDCRNTLLIAQHRMVAAVGVHDLIVVETPDAVLVADQARAQDVKTVTQFLSQSHRHEHRHHQQVHRPWGIFKAIDRGERYQVKHLTVKPGQALSLQMHHHRAEHWVVVSGTAKVTCDERVYLLTENQSTYIPVGARHRLENPGTIDLEIIEVQSGSYLGEDDIVRFDDIYQRDTTDGNQ